MRYKIQIETYNGGWSDLRASYDGENYEPCLFPTRNAALAARGVWRTVRIPRNDAHRNRRNT